MMSAFLSLLSLKETTDIMKRMKSFALEKILMVYWSNQQLQIMKSMWYP